MKILLKLGILSVFIFALATGCTSGTETSNTQDTRTQITALEDADYKSSVLIGIGESKEDYGSGSVIGENTVVTAKHVVDTEENNNYERVSINYGVIDENGEEQFVTFPVVSVEYPRDGVDLAVVEVGKSEDGKSIGEVAEIAKTSNGDDIKEESKITIVGYPGDKDYGSLWISEGKVLEKIENLLRVDAFAFSGNSGSPVYNENGDVVGVINSEAGTESFATLFGDDFGFVEDNIK